MEKPWWADKIRWTCPYCRKDSDRVWVEEIRTSHADGTFWAVVYVKCGRCKTSGPEQSAAGRHYNLMVEQAVDAWLKMVGKDPD